MKTGDEVRGIKRRHSAELLRQPGVSGVGVEKDEAGRYVLAIHVEGDDPEVRQRLPREIEGCRVKLVVSGPFRAFPG
jgi:hypothetical protein